MCPQKGYTVLKRVKDGNSSWLRSLKYILNTPGKRAMSLPHCNSNKVKLLPVHAFNENITMLFDPHYKHLRQFWFETKELVDLQNSGENLFAHLPLSSIALLYFALLFALLISRWEWKCAFTGRDKSSMRFSTYPIHRYCKH